MVCRQEFKGGFKRVVQYLESKASCDIIFFRVRTLVGDLESETLTSIHLSSLFNLRQGLGC
jgi:hypothetical protein